MPLINCEINLILTYSENYILKSKATGDAILATNPPTPAIRKAANATFKITDKKPYSINWRW